MKLQYIVNETDYFLKDRLIEEMIVDFKRDYKIIFESGRLSQLLKPHLKVLDRIPTLKHNRDGSISKKEVFNTRKRIHNRD